MTALLVRLVIFGAIGLAIYLGVRRIYRDFTGHFKQQDEDERSRRRVRDLAERQRPDVIDLKRDQDGTFRPTARDNDRR